MSELSIPKFFNPKSVEGVWRVPYQQRFAEAIAWRKRHDIQPAALDRYRIALMPIDVQNTFCQPDFELFVGGRSGRGAVEDNVRLCEFIYRNLRLITAVHPTMDTHIAAQIFHQLFWIDKSGEHPQPMTIITLDDVQNGTWQVNPAMGYAVYGTPRGYEEVRRNALHYVQSLTNDGKYPLMVWPFHSMLGGIGHALVSAVEEASFFHNIARAAQTDFQIKGGNPLTENYSVLRPEVLEGHSGKPIAEKNARFINALMSYDIVVIAGQAKSHCVAWTIADLLTEIQAKDAALARKVYLVEDLSSPVVVPGGPDFTDQANEAFQRFADAGMNVVQSTTPIADWPGIDRSRLA
jgi:nicotinamidase-related amidase